MDKAKNLYMDRFGFIEKNTLGKIYSTPSTVYVCLHFCGLTACGTSVLPPEMNSHPLYWKCWVLTMTAVVQSLSCAQFFAMAWTTVWQASLPSLFPGVCWNSCPLSQWCHPSISSFVVPFSSCLQFFPATKSFPMSHFLHQVAKVLEFQLQHQSFQWIFRTDFLWNGLVGFPCSPRDSQESSKPQFKSINSSALSWLFIDHILSNAPFFNIF